MTEIHVGFTGTQDGLTFEQETTLHDLLAEGHGHGYFHHGDCIGSDAEADALAKETGYTRVIHPPLKESKRAFCGMDDDDDAIVYEPKDYLVRNHDIVDACDILIATPNSDQETLRSGTWATVRYARKVGKPYIIIFPDGEAHDDA